MVEKKSIEQVKYLFDQLDKKAEAFNESNNSCMLIIKESDFLDLVDMTSFQINNLLDIFVDLGAVNNLDI